MTMTVGLICSNYYAISKTTTNGTAIFAYSLMDALRARQRSSVTFRVYAARDSLVPFPHDSLDMPPLSDEPEILRSGKHILWEQTLIARAFSDDRCDVFHVNIGDGDLIMPLAHLTEKPIIITLHHLLDAEYVRRFFSLYPDVTNVHFVAASAAQRTILPSVAYAGVIHHGVPVETFAFDPRGGDSLMWAGRMIPEKAPDIFARIVEATGRAGIMYGIPRVEHEAWFASEVMREEASDLRLVTGRDRFGLRDAYAGSKAFVHPVMSEEAFGLVLVESMSCGTPVIAFARGSIPEIVEDGVTGFIVNPSDHDVRGDWLVKKTGIAGMVEAVERMYAMPAGDYAAMRAACRARAESRFDIKRTANEYLQLYARLHAATNVAR